MLFWRARPTPEIPRWEFVSCSWRLLRKAGRAAEPSIEEALGAKRRAEDMTKSIDVQLRRGEMDGDGLSMFGWVLKRLFPSCLSSARKPRSRVLHRVCRRGKSSSARERRKSPPEVNVAVRQFRAARRVGRSFVGDEVLVVVLVMVLFIGWEVENKAEVM